MGWIKCPRCDLNYIKEGEEYCDVCKAELKKGPQLVFAIDDEDETEAMDLCPVCHQNYIKPGEKMCAKCAEEQDYKAGAKTLMTTSLGRSILTTTRKKRKKMKKCFL